MIGRQDRCGKCGGPGECVMGNFVVCRANPSCDAPEKTKPPVPSVAEGAEWVYDEAKWFGDWPLVKSGYRIRTLNSRLQVMPEPTWAGYTCTVECSHQKAMHMFQLNIASQVSDFWRCFDAVCKACRDELRESMVPKPKLNLANLKKVPGPVFVWPSFTGKATIP